MRYTLFLYNDEKQAIPQSEDAMQHQLEAFGAYIGALKQDGVFVDTDWLQPSATATTLTLRGGRTVQDGPYADTHEQLGGYFVIDCADLDAALAWAERCPTAPHGIIEIRPSAMPGG